MKKLAGSVLIVILLSQILHAQNRTFNLNDELGVGFKNQILSGNVSTPVFENASRARSLFINPVIQHPQSIQLNDTILLDLFENKQYKAAIDKIERDVNDTWILRGHIVGHEFGSCVISTFESKSFMSIEVPMNNELYLSKYDHQTNRYFLLQIDKAKQIIRPGSPPLIPPTGHPINYNPILKMDEHHQDTIALMIVYTPAAAAWSLEHETHINNTIATMMELSQSVLDNSNTLSSLQLVHSEQVNYSELNDDRDLNHLTEIQDGMMDEVHILGDAYGADVVVLLEEIEYVGGITWLLNTPSGLPDLAFSVNRVQQASWTPAMIHEIGHIMGCSHHKMQNDQAGPGLYDYSAGWRWTDNVGDVFCTIMTYEEGRYFEDGMSAIKLPYFSNPDLLFQGTPTGHSTEADNARTIRQTKSVVASYRNNTLEPPCPLPLAAGPISGNTAVCQGDTTIFYSILTIPLATSYSWHYSGSGVSITPDNTPNISIHFQENATSGVLIVRGSNDCGEGIAAYLPIEVNLKPSTPVISFIPGGLISDALMGNQWYDSKGLITGAISREFTPTSSGTYYVVVVSLSGCSSDASNTLNYIPTSNHPVSLVTTFSLYPNPANDELIIESKGPTDKTDFDILNARGEVVFSGTLVDKTILQISTLPPGLYLVRLKSEEAGEWLKFLKN